MPLLATRAALVLLIAVMVGVVAGTLAFHASGTRNVAAAALVGASAAGGALLMFNNLVSY